MFNKLFRRNAQITNMIETEQLMLDTLRFRNADNPLMQLHLDRMQVALDSRTI